MDAILASSHDLGIQWADKALYMAKERGRNRYVALDPLTMRRTARDELPNDNYKTA